MRRGGLLLLLAILAVPARAADVSLDVAPTALALAPGKAGLFYITNHGARDVTVQIEATDWTQPDGRDVLVPSQSLFVSPPLAHIAGGARQSVRVMARPAAAPEGDYRLVVSQLPDAGSDPGAVTVLLQFKVPVFVRAAARAGPRLAFSAARRDGMLAVSARNLGDAAVKLTGLTLDGAPLPEGLVYILPGARHDFAPMAAPGAARLVGTDALSGQPVAADLVPQ